mgnify:CR=1 FL=1
MLQWADNFSFYGSGAAGAANMLDGLPYAALSNVSSTQLPTDPDGVSSGRVLTITGTNNNSNLLDSRMAVPTPTKALGVGARFYRTTLPSSNGVRPVLIGYRSIANARMYDLIVEPNGSLSVYDSGSVLIATTTIPIFTTNTWQHIEFFVNSETGDIEVRREGVPVLTATASLLPTSSANLSSNSRTYLPPDRRLASRISAMSPRTGSASSTSSTVSVPCVFERRGAERSSAAP